MILAAGLTPAWQQIAVLDSLEIGAVNRAREFHAVASGKVINVGLALHSLGADFKTLACLGGANGMAIQAEFEANNISARWIPTDSPTRVCTTLLDPPSRQTTEIVENSAPVSPGELEAYLTAISEESRAADCIVLSGSLPRNTPKDFHLKTLRAIRNPDAQTVLDIAGPELLAALEAGPFLVKPNRHELARTLDRPLDTDTAMFDAMREIIERGAKWCVVSDGGRPSHATDGCGLFRFAPPNVRSAVNPIGCGDCLAAGIALGLSEGKTPPEAIVFGLAAAADNLEQLLPARLDRKRVEAVARTVEHTTL